MPETMRWFGASWGAPLLDEIPKMDTPFGAPCTWCDDLIDDDDSGVEYAGASGYAHYECFLRQTIGGVNHQRGTCTCCGGSDPPDPPELSARDAARAAVEFFERHR